MPYSWRLDSYQRVRGRREIAVGEDNAPWNTLEVPRGKEDSLTPRDVERALYRLSFEQREVLLLVCVEELSYQEASSALNVPVGTVMSRHSRAREHMRTLLAEGTPHRLASVKAMGGADER